jgi:hypothetical protein
LPGLEDPALRVDQWNAVALELKPGREIAGIEHSITGLATGVLTPRPRCRGSNIFLCVETPHQIGITNECRSLLSLTPVICADLQMAARTIRVSEVAALPLKTHRPFQPPYSNRLISENLNSDGQSHSNLTPGDLRCRRSYERTAFKGLASAATGVSFLFCASGDISILRRQGATLQELADSYDRSISTMRRATRAA